MGTRGRAPARGRRRDLHADHRRAGRPPARGWPWPRARSARRRSATAAPSAAISARPRPRATACRRSTSPTPKWSCARLAARGASRSADFITGPKRNALRARTSSSPPSCSRPRAARSSSPRSARATRWSSRSARSPSRSAPSDGTVPRAWARRGPTPARAREAEAFLGGVLEEEGLWDARAPIGERPRGASASSWRGGATDRRRPRHRALPPPRARACSRGARWPGPGRRTGAPEPHRQRRAA